MNGESPKSAALSSNPSAEELLKSSTFALWQSYVSKKMEADGLRDVLQSVKEQLMLIHAGGWRTEPQRQICGQILEAIRRALSGDPGSGHETTGKSRSAYISDLTVRRLDSGYVVTWQEDGEPCGSETISEKLAHALVRADGGILGITDDSAVKASGEPTDAEKRAMGVDLDSRDHEAR